MCSTEENTVSAVSMSCNTEGTGNAIRRICIEGKIYTAV
jgi:hypothetical protein